MEEHNFFITVKYGLTESLPEKIFNTTITGTSIDEKYLVEAFREFIKHIKEE